MKVKVDSAEDYYSNYDYQEELRKQRQAAGGLELKLKVRSKRRHRKNGKRK